MPIPSPKERPDLYDDYDGRHEDITPAEKEYWNGVVPDHIKDLLAQKGVAKPAEPGSEPEPAAPAEPENKNPA